MYSSSVSALSDQRILQRAGLVSIHEPAEAQFRVSSPEDVVLSKLEWYRKGGEISDKQWNDIMGVMQSQRGALNVEYLRQRTMELGVEDLLDEALLEAAREIGG